MHLAATIEFLKQVDELETANTLLLTFAKYARTIEQYDELGMLFEKIKKYHNSLAMLEKCLSLASNPFQIGSVRANLAKVYNHINEPLKSLQQSNLILEQTPDDYEAWMEQGFSYYLHGQFEKSWEIQKKLIDNPDVPLVVKERITFNMGTFDMAEGKFKSGLAKMILGGKHIGLWTPHKSVYPKWDGQPTNSVVLIYAEAGIGDEIINVRFTRELDRRGIRYLWAGHRKDTNELFKTNGYNVISKKESLDPIDSYVYAESQSLAVILDLDIDQLWTGPYLKPKQQYIDKWKAILPDKFVTLRWSGNPYYDQDLHRGVPFDQLYTTVSKYNVPIVSLQIDENRCDQHDIINVDINDWDDTLAIQHLAAVNITSCTSTAHSASAIGAQTIVLPPICTYFPWIRLRDDHTSHWYGPTTKAFPQTVWRNWDLPLSHVDKELERLL